MKRKLANLLILGGLMLFLVGAYLVWERNSPRMVSFDTPPPPQSTNLISWNPSAEGRPFGIKIPSIGKELPIVPANINNNVWETTKVGVSYL